MLEQFERGEKADALEAQGFLLKHPEIEAIDLLIPDTNGVLRGKRVHRDSLTKLYRHGVCLPGSLFGCCITGDTVEATGLGFDQGDADRLCWPLPGFVKPVPWHRHPRGQVLLTMREENGEPFFAEPRHVLEEVVDRFAELGLTPVVAVELEFYLIDRERTPFGGPQPPRSPVTGERERSTQVYGIGELDDYDALLEDVARAAEAQGIPAETAVAEYAPGQYEINLRHQPDALAACDHAVLLKRLVKGVAMRHGLEATFMAKPYEALSGNGLHVHVSLLDETGTDVFFEARRLEHGVGGLLATLAETMALLAPNVNSFRRFQVDSYVPLAPVWGANNRTVAVRVPAGPDESRRVEHRVAGADANPYLAVAVVLAGLHRGLVEGIEPPPAITGNAYAQFETALPITWEEALRACERSAFVADYLGGEFRRVFVANKRAELELFRRQVTPLEHQWYLRTV